MASPVKAAKLHHQGRGFTEVAGRGRGHLLSRKPGTEQYALTTQVGGIGWHKGQGPFTEADEIDTAWVASGGLWDWEMTQADYRAYIRDSVPVSYRYVDDATGLFIELTASQPVWVNDQGQSQNAASFSQVTPAITDDLISWANIAPGWSLRVQAQLAGLGKFLDIDTLSDLGAPTIGGTNERLRLPFTYTKSSGLTIWVDGVQWDEKNNTSVETAGNIEFRNGATPVFFARRPAAWDADSNQAPITQRVRRTGVNFYVEVDVPWTWLQAAIYPITIDPTIDVTVAASADDAEEDAGTVSIISANFLVNDTTDYAGQRWAVTGPASGDTVDVCYIRAQSSAANRPIDVTLRIEDVDSAAAFTTSSNNVSGRTAHATTVDWTGTAVANNTYYDSSSIVTPVQGVIDRAGWSSGNYLCVFANERSGGTSGITWKFWDYASGTGAPQLYMEYTAAGGGRTTKNTVSNPLGLSTAIGWRIRPA